MTAKPFSKEAINIALLIVLIVLLGSLVLFRINRTIKQATVVQNYNTDMPTNIDSGLNLKSHILHYTTASNTEDKVIAVLYAVNINADPLLTMAVTNDSTAYVKRLSSNIQTIKVSSQVQLDNYSQIFNCAQELLSDMELFNNQYQASSADIVRIYVRTSNSKTFVRDINIKNSNSPKDANVLHSFASLLYMYL